MGTQTGTAGMEKSNLKGRCDPARVLFELGEPYGGQPNGAGCCCALGHGVV